MKKTSKITIPALAVLLFFVALISCNKNKLYEVTYPEAEAHFTGSEKQNYAVRSAAVTPYMLELGTTDVVDVDRTVSFTVTSPTGATAGTQYSLGTTGNSVTIPAGESIAVIPVQGIFAGYPPGRVDTLIFTVTEPSVKVANFSNVVRLALGDICSDGVGVVISDFLGDYDNTKDINPAWGPYTTTISNATSTGATSANITVENFWDYGFNPLVFQLNWANTSSLSLTMDPQYTGQSAGILNSAYAAYELWIYPQSSGTGTFSSCEPSFTVNFRFGIPGLGYFPNYQTKIAKP